MNWNEFLTEMAKTHKTCDCCEALLVPGRDCEECGCWICADCELDEPSNCKTCKMVHIEIWAKSPEGAEAVKEAVEAARGRAKARAEARRVDLKTLHQPCDI